MSATATVEPTQAGADALGAILREYTAVTEKLSATHETLEREVARLRNELESKDRELERRRRLAALGELAAGVAHEVRNPLGAIRLYSGLLQSECAAIEPAQRLLEKIEKGIRAIEAVVQDTLSLTPGRGQLDRRPVGELIDAAIEFCQRTLRQREVAVRTSAANRGIGVLVDAQAIQRVLGNLICNAAEASPPQSTIEIDVGAETRGAVTIAIRDRGCGIAPAALEKIFDPFFTTKATGTGLGLAIAHRLVEAHGGRLTARNRSAGGAEFELLLPTTSQEARRELGGAARVSAA